MNLESVLKSMADTSMSLADPFYIRVSSLVCALVLLTIPFEVWITPFARQFRLDNPYINYPMTAEHVPVSLLAFLSIILPLGFIVCSGIVDSRMRKHALISTLGLLVSITGAMFVADVLKILIGNQRPDFIARCQPKAGTPRDQYVSVLDVCTTPDMAALWEGCKSTPSGHSALSFAGLGFLSFWIIYSFDLLRPNRPWYVRAGGFAPFLISSWVAFTRIIDHKHHWVDVLSGSALGGGIAYAAYTHVVRDSKPERAHTYSSV